MLKIMIRVVAVFLIDIFNKKIEYRFIQFKSDLWWRKKRKRKKCQSHVTLSKTKESHKTCTYQSN